MTFYRLRTRRPSRFSSLSFRIFAINRPSLFELKHLLLVNTVFMCVTSFMACLGSIEAVYAAVFAATALIACCMDVYDRGHPPRFLLNAVSLAVMIISVTRMRYYNFLNIFTEAILLMIAVKMLERKGSRDYTQIAFMSAITIIVAAVDAIDGTYVYYCVAESILAGFQLILSAWFAKAPKSSLSMKEIGWTANRAMNIWLLMLPLCLLLFFAAPRARLTLGNIQGAYRGSRTGFSDHLTLGSVKNIQEDESVAFRAKMARVDPKFLYWRGLVFDFFDGKTWRAGRERQENAASHEAPVVKQEISLENGQYMGALFALDIPLMVNAQGIISRGDGVFLNGNFRERLRVYSALSVPSDSYKPPAPIRAERFLSLPPGYGETVRILTNGITRGMMDSDKTDAIMKYLSPPEFSYTLDDLPNPDNPLEEFLFGAKQGNCEYFAAAMAIMLRMAGIPSRIVAGYRGGTYNESGGYYVVNQANAHVWVEAWDPVEKTWYRRDPTPLGESAEGGIAADSQYGFFWMYIDFINFQVSRIFMEYGGDTQSEIFDFIRGVIASPSSIMESISEIYSPYIEKTAIFTAAALFALAALYAARRFLRIRRRYGYGNEMTLKRQFLAAMERLGFEKKPCEGLEEFVNSAIKMLGFENEASGFAEKFVNTFESFHFRDIPADPGALKKMRELIKLINASPPGG